jgi:hypothetical protein
MSDSIKYSDFLIDYIDDLVKYPTRSINGVNYSVWQPATDSNIIFSDNNVDTIAEANTVLTKPNGVVGLTKEEIYNTISQLTTDDMSFFSPKIEIYRRLPAYLTLGTEGTSQESDGFIYKKFDFVDGSSVLTHNTYQDILQGKAGTGIAAIEEASWELDSSPDAKESNTEIYDYLGKFAASIKSFDIKFKFDSAMTFFGNCQNSDTQLIADFMRDPRGNLQNMYDSNLESNEITRNYAYLMFFSDIGKENTTNQITPENNNNAYNFLIKVGYSPVFYDLSKIITNPERLKRLTNFNTFLTQYPDYFNLDFQCALSGYEFLFSKDNSIILKSSFTGVVKQGSLRDLYSHRTNDMDFMKVLRNLALTSRKIDQSTLNSLQQTIKDNEKLLLDYDTASRLGCFDSRENAKYKSSWFKDVIEAELDEAKKQIVGLEQKALTHFLDDVNVHRAIVPDYEIKNYNNTILKNGANSIFNNELFDTTKRKYKAILETKNLDFYRKSLTETNSDEDIKNRTENNSDNSSDAIRRETSDQDKNILASVYTGGGSSSSITVHEIYFFFFGDLVDNIIKKFKSYHTQQTQIPLITKYQDLYCLMPNLKVHKRTLNIDGQGGLGGTGRDETGKLRKYLTKTFGTSYGLITDINAAYVPISMELWRKWTHDNIVRRQKQYYHLFDLLNDLKVLLTQAINYRTDKIIENEPKMKMMGRKPLFYSTFYQNTYEIDKNSNSMQSGFIDVLTKPITLPNVSVKVLNKLRSGYLINPAPPLKSVYLVGYTGETIEGLQPANIYPTDQKTGDRATSYITSAGDYALDMKLGITHFFIGNQMGLAKTFTFGSDATPNGREIALADSKQENRDFKSYQYNNVDIKVIGGSFFRPMEMVYVHPHHTFGEPFENKITISNLLNIGGYYQIFKVASSFNSKGVYETTLTCKYYIKAQAAANKDKCDASITEAIKKKFDVLEVLRTPAGRRVDEQRSLASQGDTFASVNSFQVRTPGVDD